VSWQSNDKNFIFQSQHFFKNPEITQLEMEGIGRNKKSLSSFGITLDINSTGLLGLMALRSENTLPWCLQGVLKNPILKHLSIYNSLISLRVTR